MRLTLGVKRAFPSEDEQIKQAFGTSEALRNDVAPHPINGSLSMETLRQQRGTVVTWIRLFRAPCGQPSTFRWIVHFAFGVHVRADDHLT